MEEEIITSSLEVTKHWQESLRAEQRVGQGWSGCVLCAVGSGVGRWPTR